MAQPRQNTIYDLKPEKKIVDEATEGTSYFDRIAAFAASKKKEAAGFDFAQLTEQVLAARRKRQFEVGGARGFRSTILNGGTTSESSKKTILGAA